MALGPYTSGWPQNRIFTAEDRGLTAGLVSGEEPFPDPKAIYATFPNLPHDPLFTAPEGTRSSYACMVLLD